MLQDTWLPLAKDLGPDRAFRKTPGQGTISYVGTRYHASIPTFQSGCLGASPIPSIGLEWDGSASHFMPTRFKTLPLALIGSIICENAN